MMGRPAALGAMGIHFFRPDLLGITRPPSHLVSGTGTHTDFRKPSILIYEPKADGSLELVAVENLVFADAWRAAGHTERPTFHGVPYDAMADDPSTALDEAHMFDPHFDRHVWIYHLESAGARDRSRRAGPCPHRWPGDVLGGVLRRDRVSARTRGREPGGRSIARVGGSAGTGRTHRGAAARLRRDAPFAGRHEDRARCPRRGQTTSGSGPWIAG